LEFNQDQLSVGKQPLQRTALGVLQQHTLASVDCQSDPQVYPQPSATWGMTQEAQYFADLDTELLLEDEQDQPQTQPQDQDQQGHQQAAAGQDSLGHKRCNQNGVLLQSLPMNHPALQTPDALALAKYHPNLQVSVAVLGSTDCYCNRTACCLRLLYCHVHHVLCNHAQSQTAACQQQVYGSRGLHPVCANVAAHSRHMQSLALHHMTRTTRIRCTAMV